MDTKARSALKADTVYAAGDRFVCASSSCAGYTAVMTGRDLCGRRLRAVDARDIAEWATYDLGALQSFPPDYPVQGTKTKQFEQVGNAVPPLLAWAVLRTVIT